MLKLLGAALILFSCAMMGFSKGGQYARRPRQIRQLIVGMQRLETEIGYGFTPLPEALAKIAGGLEEPLVSMFRQIADSLELQPSVSAKESWQTTLLRFWPQTAMRGQEREILMQLGNSLGITDREDQIKHLRLASAQLQEEERQAREEQQQFEKMWKSLGVLFGAFVVILIY